LSIYNQVSKSVVGRQSDNQSRLSDENGGHNGAHPALQPMQEPTLIDADLGDPLTRGISPIQRPDTALSDETLSDVLNKDPYKLSDVGEERKDISTEDDYVPSESTITGRRR